MRDWLLKFMGLVLWSLFLFAPFVARADDGFDIFLPYEIQQHVQQEDGLLSFLGDIDFDLNYTGVPSGQEAHQWSVKFKAGKDTVLSKDLSAKIQHDRIPLDDGEREAMRFGVGLNYTF